MVSKSYFQSKQKAESFLQGRIIAIITEYTIFKLDLKHDRVIFKCMKDEYTFDILFETIQEEIQATTRDFSEAFLETIITYCAVIAPENVQKRYPVCQFNVMDELLDWFLKWMKYSEKERLDYLETL